MTLFVDRIPERQRRDIFEFESSTSEAVGAAVEQTFFENPTTAVRRISELDEAMYGPYDYGSPGPGPGIAPRRTGPQTPLLTAEQARERTVEQGLELDIPEEGLPEGALNILMERKSAERKRQIILSSAPSGSFPITLAASFAASAIDPVNIASAFVPIFGEARIAGMLAKAGTAGGRFATRAGIGAVEGVAGAAIVEPLILAASAQDQADYDMSDSLLNVAFGGVLGGGLHSIGGYVSDLFNPIRIQHEAAIRTPETIEIPDGAARETPSPEVQGESLSRPENIRPDLVDPINIEVELRRQMETDIANTAMARAQAEILPALLQELEPLASTRVREVGDLKQEQMDLERRQSTINDTFKERAKDFQSEGLTRKRAEKAARESIAQEKAEIDERLAAINDRLNENRTQERARQDIARVREGVIPERYRDRVNQRADEIRRGAQPKPLASAVKTAREIASEAPHSVRAAALQSAIAQAMDGQPVDVENLFKLMSKPDEALNAIKTQQRVYDKEAEAFSAKVDRIAKAEKDDFESLKASTEYEEQIVNEMVQQLNNRIDRDTYQKLLDRLRPAMGEMAEDNAKQMAAFLTAHARVMGTTPTQLLDRFVLGISREDGMPEGDVLNQAGMDKWYRSALSETVKGIDKIADKNGMVQPAQAKSWLQSQQKKGAFKKEELEWVGVNDWLDTQEGKVSISDIQNFVDNSGIQIEDVELGAIYEFTATDGSTRQFTSKEAAENALNEEIEWAEKESTGDVIDNRDDPERPSISVTDYDGNEVFFASPNEDGDWSTEYGNDFYDADDAYNAAEEAMQKNIDYWLEQISSLEVSAGDGAAKYTEYQIPDGDNYREVLLTLPKSEQEYKSSHWDDENVVAHIRMNDRTDTDGNKVLFVEEVQSDWGQEARDRGFESSEMALERERVANLIKANEEMRIAIMKERSAIPEDVEHSGKKYKIDKIFLSAKAYARNPLLDEMDRYVSEAIQSDAKRMNPDNGSIEERIKIIESQPGRIERYEGRFFESRGLSGDNIKENLKDVLVDIPEAEQRSVPEIQKLREINNRLEELRSVRPRPIPAGIPSAPFVKDTKAWTALTIKRVIAMAADGGYDKVAFINGEQSADRYNLSKTVSKIYYNPKTGSLSAEGKNKQSLINQRDIPQEKLSDYIGKEAAEKIINNPTEIEADSGFHTLSGDGLVVGGEGMKVFYDRIVPQVANDVLKKTGGGKIERIDIETPNGNEWNGFSVTEEMRNQANSGLLLFQRQASLFPESNRLSNLDKNGATWKAILNENPELKNVGDTVTIYRATIGESIRTNDYVALNKAVVDDHLANLAERGETGRIITQEVPIDSLLMANDATEFVFSPSRLLDQKNRGYLSISPEKYLNIGLLKDANASTFIHESGHAYLEIMRDSARLLEGKQLTPEQSAMLDDMTTLYDWLDVKSGDEIKVEHHEKFARGFERYAAEGVAPNSALRQAFENFKKWMMDVYRSLNELDVELTNEVRAVFDRMLGGDYATRSKQDARTVDARPRTEDGRGPEETNLDSVNLANLIPELAEAEALAINAQVYSRAWRAFAVCSLGA